MCLAQGHNAVTPVRLKSMAPRSRVKHSTTALPLVTVKIGQMSPKCDQYLCILQCYIFASFVHIHLSIEEIHLRFRQDFFSTLLTFTDLENEVKVTKTYLSYFPFLSDIHVSVQVWLKSIYLFRRCGADKVFFNIL